MTNLLPPMVVIRKIRPTDLVALATFEGRRYPNLARTRSKLDRDHTFGLSVGTLIEQWISSETRHTVVAMRGLAMDGLVSARHRGGRSAWEIDALVVAARTGGEALIGPLVTEVSEEAATAGVRTVFLRVAHESPDIMALRRSGFMPYLTETLMRLPPRPEAPDFPEPPGRTRRTAQHDQDLFRLYNHVTPVAVRAVEGMTIEEWKESRDSAAGRSQQYVWTDADRLWGWLQVDRDRGRTHLRLQCDADHEGSIRGIAAAALSLVPRRTLAMALVPDYQPAIQRILGQDFGFEPVARYSVLVRQLAVRVAEIEALPAKVRLARGSGLLSRG